MPHLLVIDDEQSICWGLAKLARTMSLTVDVAASAEEGFALARKRRPDAIVLDVRLPGMDGLAALEQFHKELGGVSVIVITAHGELSTAVRAVRGGAFDYLVKPFDLDVAERVIRRAIELAERSPSPEPDAKPGAGQEMIGVSAAMQEVFKRIALVAPSDACVHLCGESGTGKELVARAIHRYSQRSHGPFVAVSLAALAPSVAESELFGHVRGAFTGAEQAHQGLLERANGGTIFLDEVAEIPLALQVKLLRALEHGEVLPVGGDRPVSSDFRVISATHRELRRQVGAGAFRHDLYFRLITFEIQLPPLRTRRDDIRPLVEHFLGLLAARGSHPRPSVTEGAIAELERRPWYGNVRELRNVLEHAMVLVRGGRIAPEHLPPPTPSAAQDETPPETQLADLIRHWAESQLMDESPSGDIYDRFLRMVEPPLLEAAMRQSRGQCAIAARQLGLHRTTLRKKLDELGIETS